MPPPFSTRHNSYLRNFANTGKAKILDTYREVRPCSQQQRKRSPAVLAALQHGLASTRLSSSLQLNASVGTCQHDTLSIFETVSYCLQLTVVC
jgi:hypothetical protein